MPIFAARAVIEQALRLIGVASAEEPIQAQMAMDALAALNSLLSSWSTDRLLAFHLPRLALALVPGQGTYTWGAPSSALTPDLPFPPPVRLELASLTVPGSPDYDLALAILTQAEYEQEVSMKAFASTYPEAVYLATSQPVAVLHVWPVPMLPYTLQLVPWPALAGFPTWDTPLAWPEGWQRLMAWNLAVEVAPEYGVEPSPTVVRTAAEAKRTLYPLHAPRGRLRLDPGGASYVSHLTAFHRGA